MSFFRHGSSLSPWRHVISAPLFSVFVANRPGPAAFSRFGGLACVNSAPHGSGVCLRSSDGDTPPLQTLHLSHWMSSWSLATEWQTTHCNTAGQQQRHSDTERQSGLERNEKREKGTEQMKKSEREVESSEVFPGCCCCWRLSWGPSLSCPQTCLLQPESSASPRISRRSAGAQITLRSE